MFGKRALGPPVTELRVELAGALLAAGRSPKAERERERERERRGRGSSTRTMTSSKRTRKGETPQLGRYRFSYGDDDLPRQPSYPRDPLPREGQYPEAQPSGDQDAVSLGSKERAAMVGDDAAAALISVDTLSEIDEDERHAERLLPLLSKSQLSITVDQSLDAMADMDRLESKRKMEAELAESLPDEHFRSHVRWGGLRFLNIRVERVFLDRHARLYRGTIYIGYSLCVLVALSGSVPHMLTNWLLLSICQNWSEEVHDSMMRNDVNREDCSQSESISSNYINNVTSPKTIVILSCAACGCLFQLGIHALRPFQQYGYSLLATCLMYAIMIALVCFFCVYDANGIGQGNATLYDASYHMIAYLPILLSTFFWFGGKLFLQNALLWIVALVSVLATTIPTLLDEESESWDIFMYIVFIPPIFVLSIMLLPGAYLAEIQARKSFLQALLIRNQQQQLMRQRSTNQKLQRKMLDAMLPTVIVDTILAQRLSSEKDADLAAIPQLNHLSFRHQGVSILFAELDGFTALSAQVRPSLVMEYLNDLFLVFDGLCDDYDVYKVETVGDQYVAAVGVVHGKMDMIQSAEKERADAIMNTAKMVNFAKAILMGSDGIMLPGQRHPARLRIGINTGPCTSGIVGTKNLRLCLFGDTVNIAARMMQTGVAGRIHVTNAVVDLLPTTHSWERMTDMEIKGKGVMESHLLKDDVSTVSHLREDAERGTGEIANQIRSDLLHCYSSAFQCKNHHSLDLSSSSSQRMSHRLFRQGGQKYLNANESADMTVYSKHTHGMLFFSKGHIELCYLKTCAHRTKGDIYIGYLILFVTGWLNFIIEFIAALYKNEESTVSSTVSTLTHLFIDSIIGYTLLAFVVIAFLGSLGHYLIHRIAYIKNKAWTFYLQWICYVLLISTSFLLLRYHGLALGEQVSNATNLCTIACASVIFSIFSGGFFVHNLLFMLVGTGIYFGVFFTTYQKGIRGESYDAFWFVRWQSIFTTLLPVFGIVILIGCFLNEVASRKSFLQDLLKMQQRRKLIRERECTISLQQALLTNILPAFLVIRLQEHAVLTPQTLRNMSQTHQGVCVLFADIVGFTAFSSRVNPSLIFTFLNNLFNIFDNLCDEYKVCKVETIGDCYVAVTGIQGDADTYLSDWSSAESNAKNMLEFTQKILRGSQELVMPGLNQTPKLRSGVHTGSCITGIVGTKSLRFCLLGEASEGAATLEKNGTAGFIHTSQDVVDLAPNYKWEGSGTALDLSLRAGPIPTYLLRIGR